MSPEAGALARPRVADPTPGRPRYQREQWQPHGWEDADGDGCNTRAEVLDVEAVGPVVQGPRCKILSGEGVDPYTGRRTTSPADLQIDHLVALAEAHRGGGWAWPPERKVAFANDLSDAAELNAVWGPENERKADHGPDRWLPPAEGFRCAYIDAYARIKARWDLTVTPAQWAAIERVWAGCGGETVTSAPPSVGAGRRRLRVGGASAPAEVAVAVVEAVRREGSLEVEAIGADALEHAVEGIAAARAALARDGREIAMAPSVVESPDSATPVLRLRVLRATLSAGQLHELLRAQLEDLVGGDAECLDAIADRLTAAVLVDDRRGG